MKILFLSFLLFFAACTDHPAEIAQKTSPSETVKKFVEISAGAKSLKDRKVLQELTIGELKRAFETMSNDDFKAHYLGDKITIENLSVEVVEEEKAKAKVHYTVTVTNRQGTDETKEVNEREVLLGNSRGRWFIESVRPIGSDKLAFTKGLIL